jgi:hypothetical protein
MFGMIASRSAGVDSITKGKKFPEASRKSCGRNLKPGSRNPQGIKNKPRKHSSLTEADA